MAALRHTVIKFVVLLLVASLPISLAEQPTRYKMIGPGTLGVPLSQRIWGQG